MKYEVTFSCGHTGTVQLYGKGVYLGENPSSNALKIRKCRAKNG